MKLFLLDGGSIDFLDWSLMDPGAPSKSRRRLANPVYIVQHPAGTLIWDTGLPDSLAGSAAGQVIPDVAVFSVTIPLRTQLADIGLDPASITYLALSHFHPDHTGNASLFTASVLLAQADELEAAFGPEPDAYGYDSRQYESLRGAPAKPLAGDYDVFGDSSVVIKRFPGHTPGSQSLLVRLPQYGTVLISGDLAHSCANWTSKAIPQVNFSRDATAASLELAHEQVRELRAEVWVQHDDEQFRQLRRQASCYL